MQNFYVLVYLLQAVNEHIFKAILKAYAALKQQCGQVRVKDFLLLTKIDRDMPIILITLIFFQWLDGGYHGF